APPEALTVGETRLGADLDAVLLGGAHGFPHHHGVGGVEAAGDVGVRDIGHAGLVVAHAPDAVALAHVTVDRHCHRRSPQAPRSYHGARVRHTPFCYMI